MLGIVSVVGVILYSFLLQKIFVYYRLHKTSTNITVPKPSVPVTITGSVEKIDGNTLTVRSLEPPTSYDVLIVDTHIYRPSMKSNYLLKPNSPIVRTDATMGDINVGQQVTIEGISQSGSQKANALQATSLYLPGIIHVMKGKIVSNKNDTLILQGVPVSLAPSGGDGREYHVTVSQETEVSRMKLPPVTSTGDYLPSTEVEKFGLSDLKENMQVVVYTGQDVTEFFDVIALRIEPIF